ncbi:MAG TPA: patatin-like protein [Pyrinomonadaceae bacterium]|nr:patatin-like protein [Pyrinomonadaceae bacterium]
MADLPTPNLDYKKEVRFAVVMYGGVSLAIYINGIAQELLRLVRSTALVSENADGDTTLSAERITDNDPHKARKLSGTERVYRKLSYLLGDDALLDKYERSILNPGNQNDSDAPPSDFMDDYLVKKTAGGGPPPIPVGFVIDILSGTSAGGINAIFLAKALANNQSIERLKQLWVQEGDIELLINDKKSVAGLPLDNQDPPQSLLNSRRMYLKLLDAFHEMDRQTPRDETYISPCVDELDLFVTATDIQGLPLSIRLSDMKVLERRHRHVFRFKYAKQESVFGAHCNDLKRSHNPFLAFAARCTSSFPFAFEPMKLEDIDEVVDNFEGYEDSRSESPTWKKFFSSYVDPDTGKPITDTKTRAFGDGGYLDNKPFSYPTETLSRRGGYVPVDRKLVYIEPSPEQLNAREKNQTPSAIGNAKAALLDLPGYETIRQDIERVNERNRLLNRVNRIGDAIERDLSHAEWKRPPIKEDEWETLDLAGMVRKFGSYYLPYRRLRIASATDELAKLVSSVAGLEENSAHFAAVRLMIRAWRELNYPDYHAKDGETPTSQRTANQFLIDFDFKYWLRRLTFIRSKIDDLLRLNEAGTTSGTDATGRRAAAIERLAALKFNPLEYESLSEEERGQFQAVVAYLKCEFSELYRELRVAGRVLQRVSSAADPNSFAAKLQNVKIGPKLLDYILDVHSSHGDLDLGKLNEDECVARAKDLFSGKGPADVPNPAAAIEEAARALSSELHKEVVDPVWTRGRSLLKTGSLKEDGTVELHPLPEPIRTCSALLEGISLKHADSIREFLWRYFSQFDDYDQVRFPILYGSDVGESDLVEIFRISPQDAPSLIREAGPGADRRRKLAGISLFHFGAFLDRMWRENDIMWGRLDGAERLITALMPDPEHKTVRDKLISDAHVAILQEEMPPASQEQLGRLLSEALIRASSGETFEDALVKVMGPLKGPKVKKRMEIAMRSCLEDKKLLDFVKKHYEVNRKLEPKPLLRSIARATQVTGKIFDDVAQSNQVDSKSIRWIARAGQIFSGLVEVAVPESTAARLFRHWLKLLYAFEILMLFLATFVLSTPGVASFAWNLLALTLATHFAVFLLRDLMRGKNRWLGVGAAVVFAAIVFFAFVGVDELANTGFRKKISHKIYKWTDGRIGGPPAAPEPIRVLLVDQPVVTKPLEPSASPNSSPAAGPTATPSPTSPARSP